METAVEIDPKNGPFRSIGITYDLVGQYGDAVASLKRYQDGSGFSESVIGVTYLRMGDFERARDMDGQSFSG